MVKQFEIIIDILILNYNDFGIIKMIEDINHFIFRRELKLRRCYFYCTLNCEYDGHNAYSYELSY